MSKAVVIDTNVLLVAEGISDFSRGCAAKCGSLLRTIQKDQIVVLDEGREILTEYGKKLKERGGQPGPGFQFWKWLINRESHTSCQTVALTKHAVRGYEEFPDHDGLSEFDHSDRKFVAVSAAHPARPEIIQAGDSKWIGWKYALNECGIRLNLPCEAELQAKWEAKIGRHA